MVRQHVEHGRETARPVSDLARLLARCPHVLLDFDGPVCSVFGGTSDRAVADQLRASLPELPADVASSSDPFDVLSHAAMLGPAVLARVADEFERLEVDAVTTATPTPGAAETIVALRRAGHTITIVSNNSAAAVAAYLDHQGLADLVDGISARTDAAPDLLKPNPHLLLDAMAALDAAPKHCVLIGDSTTDLVAAHAAGTAVIGYANKPGKQDQFDALHPNAVVDNMHMIAKAARGTPLHSVSVAGIVVRDDGRILTIQRRDNQRWEPPGGVLELDEAPQDGVRREVREETGVDVAVERLTGVYKNMPLGVVALVFRCRPLGPAAENTDEAEDVAWLTVDEIAAIMPEAFAVRVTDALADDPQARAHNGVDVLTL